MKTPEILTSTGIFSVAFSLPFMGEGQAILRERPNVVIILTDDMGYGDISCYNKNQIETPNIDRLATESVRFTGFYVPTPYCAPSRATLLTGRFPLRHGMVQNPAPYAGINDIGLNTGEVTMGELFQGAGYHTKCIGKWHLGHKPEYFPIKHGFDEYYGILYSNDMRPVQIIENKDTVEYPVNQRLLTQKYTFNALDFIQRNQHAPFFLYLAQATPADYPGLKPEKMECEMLLFDLENDPTESTDLSAKFPQVKMDMIRKYNTFLHSFHKP